MKRPFAAVVLSISILVLAAGCAHTPRPASGWQQFADRYVDAWFAMYPQPAVTAGLHQYDGKLADYSADSLRARGDFLRAARSEAMKFQLSGDEAFERDYLLTRIDQELFWLESVRRPFRDPLYYSGGLDPGVYLTRNYAPLEQRMRAMIEWTKNVPVALQQARTNLRTPLARPHVETAIGIFDGLATFVQKDAPAAFASVSDPALQAEYRATSASAAAALKSFADWLREELPRSTNDYALGPELFRQMLLSTEGVDIPLDRLVQIGQADMERNLAALREACGRFAPGRSLEECVAISSKNKPADGVVAAAGRQLVELRQFVVDHDLVSLPGKELAIAMESPPYARWNIAFINVPGPYEHGLPSVYSISPPDPSWSKEEQEAYVPSEPYLLAISVHEVWPGHFVQHMVGNRVPSKIGRVLKSYASSEGWAHYVEEMMIDAGLRNGDPETRIGQLLNALFRDARYLSALGLHTGGMTVEESERLFREKAFSDPGNARQQARRGTYDPGYLNYTLGKLMIMKLRDDWTSTRGGRAAWKEFHDAFLSLGGAPIPLVRKKMLGDGSPPL